MKYFLFPTLVVAILSQPFSEQKQKRSAEAEATPEAEAVAKPEAEADAYYRHFGPNHMFQQLGMPTGYNNHFGYKRHFHNYNPCVGFQYPRHIFQGYSKRSADADAEADAYYGRYGYRNNDYGYACGFPSNFHPFQQQYQPNRGLSAYYQRAHHANNEFASQIQQSNPYNNDFSFQFQQQYQSDNGFSSHYQQTDHVNNKFDSEFQQSNQYGNDFSSQFQHSNEFSYGGSSNPNNFASDFSG